jgi:hypothetical protein
VALKRIKTGAKVIPRKLSGARAGFANRYGDFANFDKS